MIDLKREGKYPGVLNIREDGFQVGSVYYDRLLPDDLRNVVIANGETDLLESVEKLSSSLQIESVHIFDVFKNKGFLEESVRKLEAFAIKLNRKEILISDEGLLLGFYTSIGYEKVGYLQSIKRYIMKKKVK